MSAASTWVRIAVSSSASRMRMRLEAHDPAGAGIHADSRDAPGAALDLEGVNVAEAAPIERYVDDLAGVSRAHDADRLVQRDDVAVAHGLERVVLVRAGL